MHPASNTKKNGLVRRRSRNNKNTQQKNAAKSPSRMLEKKYPTENVTVTKKQKKKRWMFENWKEKMRSVSAGEVKKTVPIVPIRPSIAIKRKNRGLFLYTIRKVYHTRR